MLLKIFLRSLAFLVVTTHADPSLVNIAIAPLGDKFSFELFLSRGIAVVAQTHDVIELVASSQVRPTIRIGSCGSCSGIPSAFLADVDVAFHAW
jgi:hypothetical protein